MPNRAWQVLALFAGLLSLALPRVADAQTKSAPVFKVGVAYRSFTPQEPYNWRGSPTHALSTVVWYPATAKAVEQPILMGPPDKQVLIAGSAAQDASLAGPPSAKFPLIALSHGTGGSALSMGWLGTALASHGYIVAAVNHPGNNAVESYTALGFSIWWERARDLSVVIDNMLTDSTFGGRIDAARIAATGFSLGGYTMIEIAGGITEPSAFLEFCASPRADGICKSPPEFPTLVEDFVKLSKTDTDFQAALHHASDSYRDPRVRAVFAMAPALGPVFPPAGLGKISIPVEIVAGEADTNVPIASGAKYFAANIPGANLKTFPGVGHYTFLDSCDDYGRRIRPDLCTDGTGVSRDAIHTKTVALAVEFFGAALK
ncbi:MAG TPA: peptidase [Candidatus Methylomirabilis sp.]|nr:peptidase [Candidatus Methylomirabilis sp.]